MLSEDIYEAMAEVINTKRGTDRGTDYIGSYWFELLYTALQTNHPDLAEKALEHASSSTKIGMRDHHPNLYAHCIDPEEQNNLEESNLEILESL